MSLAQLGAAAAAATGVFGIWDAGRWLEDARRRGALGALLGTNALDGEGTGAEQRRLRLVVAATLAAAGALLGGLPLAIAAAAAGPATMRWYVGHRAGRHRDRVAAGMPMAARGIADALTGGHTLTAAFGRAALGTPGPAGEELARVAQRAALGASVEDAVHAMRARVDDPGWEALATAVVLQREVGGDLAALLRSLAAASEDGARSEALARAALAQARATAQLIAAVPAVALLAVAIIDPGTITTMVSRAPSLLLLLAAVGLAVTAALLLRRLARSVEAP